MKPFKKHRNRFMSCATNKGLLNQPGENNCFLNSAIQVLWHLDVFRRSFRLLEGHACMGASCIFCALKNIFQQFQYSKDHALAPNALRSALAETFHEQNRFQLGSMDDAAECFENILTRIHVHIGNEVGEDVCTAPHCIPHQKFGLTLVEQYVCSCGATSEPVSYIEMVHYVSATALCSEDEAMRNRYGAPMNCDKFGRLVRVAGSCGDRRVCPSKCGGQMGEVRKVLMNRPDVVSVGIIWDSEKAQIQEITNLVNTLGTTLRLSDLFHTVVDEKALSMQLVLVGMVCYYGKHYSTFFFHSKLKKWVYFDDAQVSEVGKRWAQVIDKCIRSHHQPLLLLYANAEAQPISTNSAPKHVTMLPGYSLHQQQDDGDSIEEFEDDWEEESSGTESCQVPPPLLHRKESPGKSHKESSKKSFQKASVNEESPELAAEKVKTGSSTQPTPPSAALAGLQISSHHHVQQRASVPSSSKNAAPHSQPSAAKQLSQTSKPSSSAGNKPSLMWNVKQDARIKNYSEPRAAQWSQYKPYPVQQQNKVSSAQPPNASSKPRNIQKSSSNQVAVKNVGSNNGMTSFFVTSSKSSPSKSSDGSGAGGSTGGVGGGLTLNSSTNVVSVSRKSSNSSTRHHHRPSSTCSSSAGSSDLSATSASLANANASQRLAVEDPAADSSSSGASTSRISQQNLAAKSKVTRHKSAKNKSNSEKQVEERNSRGIVKPPLPSTPPSSALTDELVNLSQPTPAPTTTNSLLLLSPPLAKGRYTLWLRDAEELIERGRCLDGEMDYNRALDASLQAQKLLEKIIDDGDAVPKKILDSALDKYQECSNLSHIYHRRKGIKHKVKTGGGDGSSRSSTTSGGCDSTGGDSMTEADRSQHHQQQTIKQRSDLIDLNKVALNHFQHKVDVMYHGEPIKPHYHNGSSHPSYFTPLNNNSNNNQNSNNNNNLASLQPPTTERSHKPKSSKPTTNIFVYNKPVSSRNDNDEDKSAAGEERKEQPNHRNRSKTPNPRHKQDEPLQPQRSKTPNPGSGRQQQHQHQTDARLMFAKMYAAATSAPQQPAQQQGWNNQLAPAPSPRQPVVRPQQQQQLHQQQMYMMMLMQKQLNDTGHLRQIAPIYPPSIIMPHRQPTPPSPATSFNFSPFHQHHHHDSAARGRSSQASINSSIYEANKPKPPGSSKADQSKSSTAATAANSKPDDGGNRQQTTNQQPKNSEGMLKWTNEASKRPINEFYARLPAEYRNKIFKDFVNSQQKQQPLTNQSVVLDASRKVAAASSDIAGPSSARRVRSETAGAVCKGCEVARVSAEGDTLCAKCKIEIGRFKTSQQFAQNNK